MLALIAPAGAHAALPDPLAYGPYSTASIGNATTTPTVPSGPGVTNDYASLGLVQLNEPSGTGGANTGATAVVTIADRGTLYYPTSRATPSPLIILVHGNHSSCRSGTAPNCTFFSRSDRGYNYMAKNLASWGYVVFSLDQDQLIGFQDGNAKGMHQRRLLIAATLDALYTANQPGGLPMTPEANIGTALVGKIDFNRIGLMGHSRGGDAVSSFIDYNRTRPLPGRRYAIRAVISLAPTDYERRSSYGTVYVTDIGACDGDVSNLMGTRMFQRGLYAGDPFPKIQQIVHGANHNYFNSEWFVEGDDSSGTDPACGPAVANSIRLSGGAYKRSDGTAAAPTVYGTPGVNDYGSDDPALMGDQERIGLATMGEVFRRYVGGELGFDPYLTGETGEDGTSSQLPASVCSPAPADTPTQAANLLRMPCKQRLTTTYFAPAQERFDILKPDPDNPLTTSAMGTTLTGTGFSNPYYVAGTSTAIGSVTPPPTTPGGYDWCNPEPNEFTPSQNGVPTTFPTAKKGCPLPLNTPTSTIGSQSGTRESAPVNHSYAPQFALAWDDPVATTGSPAVLQTRIPALYGNASAYKTLSLGASVNYFDTRNPARIGAALYDPSAQTSQDFTIELTDAAGVTASVSAGDPRWGNALKQTIGNTTPRVHIILQQIRVPLSVFQAQGLDITKLRNIAFKFGGAGKPTSGSIQLANVRFAEAVTGPTVYADVAGAPGAADVVPANSFPQTQAIIDAGPRAAAGPGLPDVVWINPVTSTVGELATPVTGPDTLAAAGDAVSSLGALAKTALTGCLDQVKPTARIVSKKLSKGRLTVKGTAKDKGCAAGVKSVQVTLKQAGKKAKTYLAKGTKTWTMTLKTKLKPGKYKVIAQALDASGNLQTTGTTSVLTVR